MKRKPIYARVGEISSGTLKTDDLIDSFSYELRTYLKRLRLSRDQRKGFNALLRECQDWQDIELGNNPRWATAMPIMHNERGSVLVGELTDVLNEIAPPYSYFGANEGDGASFGFWVDTENDELPRLNAGDEIDRDHWGSDVYLINDHGNVDCGYVNRRGEFNAYWSVV